MGGTGSWRSESSTSRTTHSSPFSTAWSIPSGRCHLMWRGLPESGGRCSRRRPPLPNFPDRVMEALDGCVFVAQNVRFDCRFPFDGTAALRPARTARRTALHGQTGAPGTFASPPTKSRCARLALTRCRSFGTAPGGWATRAPTAQILRRMLADARRADVDTWEQLQAYLRQPRPRVTRSYLPQPMTGMEAIA